VSGVAAELSCPFDPAGFGIGWISGQTSQLTAIGTFSEAPVTQNLTNSTTIRLRGLKQPGRGYCLHNWFGSSLHSGNRRACYSGKPGAAAITAIASNPDGSVVTGAITFTVTNSGSEQVSSLTVVPSAISISATGQPGQLIAVATLTSGLQEDVTNSPQLGWTTSLPTVATVCTQASGNIPAFCPNAPGELLGVSAGTTNLTAEFTNPASGSTPANVITPRVHYSHNSPAAEPLLSINVLPGNVTVFDLDATAQYLAFGIFSTAPTEMDITNGFYHSGYPNAACTAALAAANTAAVQVGTAAPNAQCSFVPTSWFSLPEPLFSLLTRPALREHSGTCYCPRSRNGRGHLCGSGEPGRHPHLLGHHR